MEENERITKIIVNREDELTDVVSGILSAKTERIIVTFAEESDILISPINLSVIKETADDAGKTIICQIIKNPTGQRNSSLAGIVAIDTPNNPTEEMWGQAKEKDSDIPPVTSVKIPTQEQPTHFEDSPLSSNKGSSDFEKKINEAIQKNRADREKKEKSTYAQDGLIISVGEDLPAQEENISAEAIPPKKGEEFIDLSKIDFNNIKEGPSVVRNLPKFHLAIPAFLKHKTSNPQINQLRPESPFKRKIKKLLPVMLISIVAIAVLAGFIYFNTGPFVKVRIYVKAQQVSVEKIFTGDPNINAIDFQNLKIPVKTETLNESRSTSLTATGTAYKGDKATGSVVLINPGKSSTCTTLQLSAGQIITSSDGKTYSLDNAASIACSNFVTVTVHATDIGEEYNSPNSYFTVNNYSDSQVFGTKSGDFTGGTKTQYTVLSQSDVNTASDQLKASSIKEIEDSLNNKQGTDWTIISDSIKTSVDPATVKTDVAVGSAATQVNLSLTVTGTATYYLSNGFNQGIETLLTQQAQAQNLFQSDQNLELVLSDKVQTDVSVVQSNDTSILIKLDAKGSVEPQVDKNQIVSKLQTMNWADGTKYLDSLKYSDKATEYDFNPVNFPHFLYYFPKRQGGIIIDVVDI